MTIRNLFATRLYEGDLGDEALVAGLGDACRELSMEDRAGRAWSKQHGYRGYTSYASLNDLPARDPRFADLARALRPHVATFARDCGFDGRPKLDSLWANMLKPGGAHSGHIHPHSAISGTVYIEVPDGSGSIRFEDPRLPLMMAAPLRRANGDDEHASFVHVVPRPGMVLLWESWLRHEVMAGSGKGERISVSFNYRG